jgi:hypothetical protein
LPKGRQWSSNRKAQSVWTITHSTTTGFSSDNNKWPLPSAWNVLGHWAKSLMQIIPIVLWEKHYYHHFPHEKMEAQQLALYHTAQQRDCQIQTEVFQRMPPIPLPTAAVTNFLNQHRPIIWQICRSARSLTGMLLG